MRNLKKFLALVLAFVMAMSLMVTANASKNVEFANDGDKINEAFVDDITVLAGMGIIKGVTTDEFQPTEGVTRAEMAAIVYRLVTGDAEDKLNYAYAGYGDFTDVTADKWYAGYVGYCANAGIIKGYGDGRFGPSNPVTGYEALVMLLRAMGYDQPNEFSGADWRQKAASIATTRGMLANVNKTRYENTLSQGATREFAAEVAFQAATKAMVQYTTAFGYQTTGMEGGLLNNWENPSLGEKWYGLTDVHSVIVANQATGAGATVLGRGRVTNTSSDNVLDQYGYPVILEYADETRAVLSKILTQVKADGSWDTDYTDAKTALDAALAGGTNGTKWAYMTESNQVTVGIAAQYTYGALNMSFDAETGLDQFAHEVTVWYDYKNPDDDGIYPTYAVLDKVKSDEAFFAADNSKVGKVASIADDKSVRWSDRYSQIESVLGNATTNLSPISTYRKVVNPTMGTVYIALSAEVAEITQKNTTAKDSYLILGTTADNASDFGNGVKGNILLANLTPDTKEEQKKVGETIMAHQIVGTSFTLAKAAALNCGTPGVDGVNDDADDVLYQLDPMETKTITVKSFQADTPQLDSIGKDSVIKVTPTSGDALELSGITLGDSTNSKIISQALPIAVKEADASKAWNIAPKANTTYTVYVDMVGRFISMVPDNGYEFLYGTYADYAIGGLGTGTIVYNMVGVDWNGKVKGENTLVSMTLDDDDASAGDITNSNDVDGVIVKMDGTVYNKITTVMKDQGQSAAAGNEIKPGHYTGYMYNAGTKDLAAHEYDMMTDTMQDTGASIDAGTEVVWTITAQDAINGFVKVLNGTLDAAGAEANGTVDYLMTKDTHFIVVSGTGTATVDVKEYTGLADFLQGASNASISFDPSATNGQENEVIFRTESEKYGSSITTKNGVITDIILSVGNVNRWSTQNLYFDFDQTEDTGVVLPGTKADKVKQYELWSNGVMDTYFIDVEMGDGDELDLATGKKDGLFFTLAKAYEVNGTPIYMAVKATAAGGETDGKGGLAGSGFVAQNATYEYVTVSNLHTGLFKVGTANKVLNLDNVTVCDVEWKVEQAATGKAKDNLERSEITNVTELNNAVSVGKLNNNKEYTINVAVVYDNSNASAVTIYVLSTNNFT